MAPIFYFNIFTQGEGMPFEGIDDYMNFGATLDYLFGVYDIVSNSDSNKPSLQDTIAKIDKFIAYCEKFDFRMTERVASELLQFREMLAQRVSDFDFEHDPQGARPLNQSIRAFAKALGMDGSTYPIELDARTADELTRIMLGLKNILDEELGEFRVFVVTEKRLGSVQSLVSDVSRLFSTNVFAALPDVAQFDFQEVGRCIAFELPTAAAFHLTRGTEDVLRRFYFAIVGETPPRGEWGLIIQTLRKREMSHLRTLLDHLDNIRNNFRNPIAHPETVYSDDAGIEEVEILFHVCIDVVDRMVASKEWSTAFK